MPAIMIGQKTPKKIYDELNEEFKSKKNKLLRIDSKDIDYFIPKVCNAIHQVIYGLIANLDLIATNKHPGAGWKDFVESNLTIFNDFEKFEKLLNQIDNPFLEKEITDEFSSRKRKETNTNLNQIKYLLTIISDLLEANNIVINEISKFLNNPENSRQATYDFNWFQKIIAGFSATWQTLLVYDSFDKENNVYAKFAVTMQKIQKNMLGQLTSESDLFKQYFETISHSEPNTSQIANREYFVALMNLVHKEAKSSSKSVEQMINLLLEKNSDPAETQYKFTETFFLREWHNKFQLLTHIKRAINNLQFTSPNSINNQRKAIELIDTRIESVEFILKKFRQIINLTIDNSEGNQNLCSEIKQELNKDKQHDKTEDSISDQHRFNQAFGNFIEKFSSQDKVINTITLP